MGRRATRGFMVKPDALDDLKMDLCFIIQREVLRKQWTQKQMSIYLGTSRAICSQIDYRKIKKLTVSQLFLYLAKIAPHFQCLIAV